MAYNLGYVDAGGYNLGYTGAYTAGPGITAADDAVEAQVATVTIANNTADPTELRLGGTVVAFTYSAGVLTYTAPLLPNNPNLTVDVDVDSITISTTIAYTNTYIYTHTPTTVEDGSIIPESSFGTSQLVELKVITDSDPNILTVDWPGYDTDNFVSDVADFTTAVSDVAASTDVVIGYHITEDGSTGSFTRTLEVIDAPVDTTPDQFTFTDLTNQLLSTVIESDVITVTGVEASTDIPVSITGGEYSVSTDNGSTFGAYTSANTNVQLNYQIKVRHTTSATNNDVVTTTLTVGGVSDDFTSTTETAVGVVPQGTITIGTITVDTNTASVPFTYDDTDQTGFEYSIDGGAYTSTTSPINLSSLNDNQQYSISIRAINASGSGTIASTTFTTDEIVTLAPQSTVIVAFVETTANSISISFTYPGSDATSFERQVGGGSWSTVTSPFTVSSLNADTSYTINLKPVNSNGDGDITTISVKTSAVSGVSEYVSAFTVPEKTNQRKLVYVESSPIAVKGVLESTRTASVNSGQLAVSTDGGETYGSWVTSASVTTGDIIKVRHVSSNTNGATTSTVLTIDDKSETFSSVTTADVYEPDSFSFTDKTDAIQDRLYVSDAVIVQGTATGFNLDIFVEGGEYQTSTDGSTWTSWTNIPGFIQAGNYVRVRNTSSIDVSDSVTTRLWINSTYADYTITTYTPDSTNRSVKVQLVGGVVSSGLRYALFRGTSLATAELIAQGTNGSINAEGEFTLNVTNSALKVNDSVIVVTSNFQGLVNELSKSAYIVGTVVEVS